MNTKDISVILNELLNILVLEERLSERFRSDLNDKDKSSSVQTIQFEVVSQIRKILSLRGKI